jgi:hypothetical protein
MKTSRKLTHWIWTASTSIWKISAKIKPFITNIYIYNFTKIGGLYGCTGCTCVRLHVGGGVVAGLARGRVRRRWLERN